MPFSVPSTLDKHMRKCEKNPQYQSNGQTGSDSGVKPELAYSQFNKLNYSIRASNQNGNVVKKKVAKRDQISNHNSDMLQQFQQQQQANLPPGIAFIDNTENEDLDQDGEFDDVNSIDEQENLDLTNGDFEEDGLDEESHYVDEENNQEHDQHGGYDPIDTNLNNSFDDDTLEENLEENDYDQNDTSNNLNNNTNDLSNNYDKSAIQTADSTMTSLNQSTPKSNNRRKNNQNRKPHINCLPIKNENIENYLHNNQFIKSEDESESKEEMYEDELENQLENGSPQMEMTQEEDIDNDLDSDQLVCGSQNQDHNQASEIAISNLA